VSLPPFVNENVFKDADQFHVFHFDAEFIADFPENGVAAVLAVIDPAAQRSIVKILFGFVEALRD